MRIIININRTKRGDRHAPLEVRTFYDTDPRDDMKLHNAGVELYNIWVGAIESALEGAVIRNEGVRK